ncbi:MAG: DUF1549 domain-containing protein, partial [Planctomycetaceae bacterium]|nr:DUF1549 domain-containing protein [Planctomycetaceae bacterium]
MRLCFICLLCWLSIGVALPADNTEFSAEQLEFFEKQVRPLLVEHCVKCHGSNKQEANLRLDSRGAILKGGDTGPAVEPGQPTKSELVLAVSYDPAGYQMPPDGKLSEEQIAIFTRWVELGAPWPAEDEPAATDPAAKWEEEFARRMEHWSFLPLTRRTPPTVQDSSWCRTPIDRFVLARLEEAGLPHAEEADRRTWLRRLSLDVTGLPPTSDEVNRFLADESPGAHERAVDRLLASPHFGERWGRHWLDLVRYAESRGHEFDHNVANAWPYRDYVIRALNADVPYDRFVIEHVAGDQLSDPGPVSADDVAAMTEPHALSSLRLDPATGVNESVLGTGFWFFGEWVHSPVDIRQEEADRFDNMIDVYSKTFLGLTVACARCHDHKFDPIPQSDFYALQGYLQSSSYRQARFETEVQNRRVADELQRLRRDAAAELLPLIQELARPVMDRRADYLLAAREVLSAGAIPDDLRKETVFADFETGGYDGWE